MSARPRLGALRRFAGAGANSSGHLEKWVSGAGGLVGILGVLLVSQAWLDLSASATLVASMGASAVLLFAVPHGPLSQPWAVFGGHLVSAVIGVACARLNAHPLIASASAVALAISAMYYLRCIHPPGGATALTAVAGGDAVHALGFHYVLTPVLLNVLVILLVALLFNLPFPWRRYPAAWARRPPRPAARGGPAAGDIPQEALATAAATDPGTGEPHPENLRALAHPGTEAGALQPADIRTGGCYCNGAFGPGWQVRQVVRERDPGAANGGPGTLSYRVVAGFRRRRTGAASREAFAAWARYEVILNENSWQRVPPTPRPALADNAA